MAPIQQPTNSDFDWDAFDPASYKDHNYRVLRDDDREILEFVRNYFAGVVTGRGLRGVDMGAGPNLYPALSMLPFCSRIDLYEHSTPNVAWLRRQVEERYDDSWDAFWEVLAVRAEYQNLDPRRALRQVATVVQGDVFKLRQRPTWDLGTMFFAAESMTADMNEFRTAVEQFMGALNDDAPFAMAFMKGSKGYKVGGQMFPAVAIRAFDVAQCFEGLAHDVKVHDTTSGTPLRPGYEGMMVAVGRARADRRSNEDSAKAAAAGDVAVADSGLV